MVHPGDDEIRDNARLKSLLGLFARQISELFTPLIERSIRIKWRRGDFGVVKGTEEEIEKAKKIMNIKKQKKEKKEKQVKNTGKNVKNKKIKYSVKTSSGGRTFGSISKSDVEKHLIKELKLKDSKVDVDLAQPIKQVGKYQ